MDNIIFTGALISLAWFALVLFFLAYISHRLDRIWQCAKRMDAAAQQSLRALEAMSVAVQDEALARDTKAAEMAKFANSRL
jgi:hypothetical protein